MSETQAPAHHPGEYIREKLEERGWTQRVLAMVLDANATSINHVVAGRRDVDASLAVALGKVFSVPPETFLDMQRSYDLARVRPPDPAIERRAQLFSLPVMEMKKRGWVHGDTAAELEASVAAFYGADFAPAHAARKTGLDGPTALQNAWVLRAKQMASEMLAPSYSPERLRAGLGKLARLMLAPEEVRHVPRVLEECGVRFVLVEVLPQAKIDGACFWLADDKPVVAMSLRFDRIDNFWFVLRHELEHVLQRHGREAVMIDDLQGDAANAGPDVPDEERVANEAASNFCVPADQLDSFIARKQPYFAERDILGFAARLKIHPGLVAGQLRHRLRRYDLFAKHLVKVRKDIAPVARVDGWGDVAPIFMGDPQWQR